MVVAEVMLSATVLGVCGFWVHKARESTKNFHRNADNVINVIKEFKRMNDLENYDLVLSDKFSPIQSIDEDGDTIIQQNFIGQEVKKGYDLVHVKVKEGFLTPFHSHRTSEEFIYVLDGTLDVFVCPESIENCPDECDCVDKVENRERLHPEYYYFLRHNLNHAVKAVTDCEFIIIALPPLVRIKEKN